MCYVLDEPTIGLHARDNRILLDALHKLGDKGNTLVVVEHDEDTIRRAEHIIDIGPSAGQAWRPSWWPRAAWPILKAAADSQTGRSCCTPCATRCRPGASVGASCKQSCYALVIKKVSDQNKS